MFRILSLSILLIACFSISCTRTIDKTPNQLAAEWQAKNPDIVSKLQEQAAGGGAAPQVLPSKPEDTDFLDNGIIKIGVNKGAGAAITYLADKQRNQNLVNNYDLGRQIQTSLYSGPVPFSQNGKSPNPAWTNAGWNPVQAGDTYGNWSKTLEFKNDGKQIYSKAIPMQWALNGELCDCIYENWISLENNTVKVRSRLTNNRLDRSRYNAHFQELPAVILNSFLYKIYTYSGTNPFQNEAVSTINNQDVANQFPALENWVALVGDDNWGVGVWKPDTYRFVAGFFGKPKSGGETEYGTSYMAPVQNEILDHNIVYEFDYTLILGQLDDIRAYVYKNTNNQQRLPNYRFEKDRQHFYYTDKTTDAGLPNGELNINLDQPLTELYGPYCQFKATDVPKIYITAAYQTNQTTGRLYWYKDPRSLAFVPAASITYPIIADGQYHTYELDLSKHSEWNGNIFRLMLAPIDRQTGGNFKIKSITYLKN